MNLYKLLFSAYIFNLKGKQLNSENFNSQALLMNTSSDAELSASSSVISDFNLTSPTTSPNSGSSNFKSFSMFNRLRKKNKLNKNKPIVEINETELEEFLTLSKKHDIKNRADWHVSGYNHEDHNHNFANIVFAKLEEFSDKVKSLKLVHMFNFLGNFLTGEITILKNISEEDILDLDEKVKNIINKDLGVSTPLALKSLNLWNVYSSGTMKESKYFVDSKNFDKDIIHCNLVKDNNGFGFNIELIFNAENFELDFPEFQATITSPDPEKETLKPSDYFHVLIRARFNLPRFPF